MGIFFTSKQEKFINALKAGNIEVVLKYLRELTNEDEQFTAFATTEVLREEKLMQMKNVLAPEDIEEIKKLQKLELNEKQVAQNMAKMLVEIEALLANPLANRTTILRLVKQYDDLVQTDKVLHAQAIAEIEAAEKILSRDIEGTQKRASLAKKKAKLAEAEALAQESEKKAQVLAELQQAKREEQAKTLIEREKELRQLPGFKNAIYGFFSRATEALGLGAKGAGELAVGVGTGTGAAAVGLGKGSAQVGIATGEAARGAGKAVKETGSLVATATAALARLFKKRRK